MSQFISSLNPYLSTQYSYAAPWLSQASGFTDVITSEYYKGNLVTSGVGSGAAVTSWTEEKGGIGGGITGLTIVLDYASRAGCAVQFGTAGGGGNGSATFDAVGSKIAGTAIPWDILISCQLRANTLGGGPIHYLCSFGSTTSVQPFIGASILTGSTQLVWQRRNTAGTIFTTPTAMTLGTATPAVVGARYNGTSIDTYLNGTLIDNAFAFGGGAMACNRFTLGGLRLNGAASGFSNMTFSRFVMTAGANVNLQRFLECQQYLLRRAGL